MLSSTEGDWTRCGRWDYSGSDAGRWNPTHCIAAGACKGPLASKIIRAGTAAVQVLEQLQCRTVADAGRQMNCERERERGSSQHVGAAHSHFSSSRQACTTEDRLSQVDPRQASPRCPALFFSCWERYLTCPHCYYDCILSLFPSSRLSPFVLPFIFPLSDPYPSIHPPAVHPLRNASHLYLSWVIREPISLEYRAQSGISILYRRIACF